MVETLLVPDAVFMLLGIEPDETPEVEAGADCAVCRFLRVGAVEPDGREISHGFNGDLDILASYCDFI